MDNNYRLSKFALKEINNPATRMRIAIVLGVSEFSISRWIQKNNYNLTRWPALEVMKKVTKAPLHTLIEVTEIRPLKTMGRRMKSNKK